MSKYSYEDDQTDIKAILLGAQGLGKTNLINLATRKEFNTYEESTNCATFDLLKMEIDGIKFISIIGYNRPRKIQALTKLFFNNSKIVIFVYDITSAESFKGIESWHQDILDQIGNDIIKGVVGNKTDLFMSEAVSEEEEDYAKSISAKFLSISAKRK